MKKLIIMFVLISALLLSGCGESSKARVVDSRGIAPNITILGDNEWTYTCNYVVDESTGVVYILFNSWRRGGITVALNPDGTPVTKEQLYKQNYIKEEK